jgi:aldose 1-epimerase
VLNHEPLPQRRREQLEHSRGTDILNGIYSGSFLTGTLIGKHGHVYRMGDGVALEPQKFPDTPNQPGFGSARVEPGRPYTHRRVYRVSVMR